MKKILTTVFFCAALSAHAAPALAATPEQLARAQQLLSAAQPQQAFAMLEAAHDFDTASTQEFFLLGISAKLSNQLEKSEQYFLDALALDPNAGRIRLELAEVLYRQGKLDASRRALVAVRNMNPPQQVLQNIKDFIAQVDAEKADPNNGPQKNWSAYITTGFTSDSNVNAGPDTNSVFLYGIPFTLSSDAQEAQDTALTLGAGVNHQVQLDNGVIWRSNADLSVTNYSKINAYDTTSISIASGPSLEPSDRMGLYIPITYNFQRYAEQSKWYSQSWGIAPRFQYEAKENLQFYLDTSISRKRFEGNRDRDTKVFAFNPSLNFQPGKNSNIATGLQYGRENSGLDIYSSTVRGAYVGYQYNFSEQGIRTSLTASYTSTQFDGVQAAYTEARDDLSRKLSASLTYVIPKMESLSVLGSMSYQVNKSNLDINNFARKQFSISLSKIVLKLLIYSMATPQSKHIPLSMPHMAFQAGFAKSGEEKRSERYS